MRLRTSKAERSILVTQQKDSLIGTVVDPDSGYAPDAAAYRGKGFTVLPEDLRDDPQYLRAVDRIDNAQEAGAAEDDDAASFDSFDGVAVDFDDEGHIMWDDSAIASPGRPRAARPPNEPHVQGVPGLGYVPKARHSRSKAWEKAPPFTSMFSLVPAFDPGAGAAAPKRDTTSPAALLRKAQAQRDVNKHSALNPFLTPTNKSHTLVEASEYDDGSDGDIDGPHREGVLASILRFGYKHEAGDGGSDGKKAKKNKKAGPWSAQKGFAHRSVAFADSQELGATATADFGNFGSTAGSTASSAAGGDPREYRRHQRIRRFMKQRTQGNARRWNETCLERWPGEGSWAYVGPLRAIVMETIRWVQLFPLWWGKALWKVSLLQ